MPPELGHVLDQARIDEMSGSGFWPDRLLIDDLADGLARHPDKLLITDNNSVTGRQTSFSYRQFDRITRRIALGLVELGVGKGDVVACQLPNWWQIEAMIVASCRIGAIINNLMPIFRERELEYMLRFAESKVVVCPGGFRGHDHGAMMRALQRDLPDLAHVLVIGDDGGESFEDVLLAPRHEDRAGAADILAARRPGANDVIQLQYTSGTTGAPKGALHTSNTLYGNILPVIEAVELGADEVVLMASPIAHQTGFLYGVMMPLILGGRTVLQDIWDPATAACLIQDEGVSFTMGATPFLADLSAFPDLADFDVSSLQRFASAGAPIPRVLVETASERLGARVVSGWGMTENGLVTAVRLGDPPEKIFQTDGRCIAGMDVRVVDEDGADCPVGVEGELLSRGAANFVGYMRKPELNGIDAEGWFDTGDRAILDEDGYIRISGRSKDIIIRGGENVPVVEVEELLYRHPGIVDAQVVGMPDDRLGERGCAIVTVKPGANLTFEAMVDYLLEARLAKQYLPERLEVIAEMPRTPSGKIQKYKLRERVAGWSVAG